MWLKKQLLKWQLKRITKNEPVKMFTPDRQQTLELLHLLNTEQFDRYVPRIGLRTEMKLLHKSLEELIINLQDIEHKLRTKNFIATEDVTTTRYETNIENYFVTKQGHMVELPDGVLHFKSYAIGICEILQRQQGETQAHYEHNVRMLTHVFADIQILARALLSIAYQKGA